MHNDVSIEACNGGRGVSNAVYVAAVMSRARVSIGQLCSGERYLITVFNPSSLPPSLPRSPRRATFSTRRGRDKGQSRAAASGIGVPIRVNCEIHSREPLRFDLPVAQRAFLIPHPGESPASSARRRSVRSAIGKRVA